MTELETLQRAKMYIDKLANGINPIDDTPAPDEDIINNVRLSRCFFYVSGILQQVIDNNGAVGGAAPSSKGKKPFSLTFEQRERYAFSDTPIPVSEIANRINDLIDDENSLKFRYSSVTAWLIDTGMLINIDLPDDRTAKRPTPQGNEIGIFTEDRMGANGPYTVVLYNRDAQKFIIDNIDAILEKAAADKAAGVSRGRSWNEEADRLLGEMFHSNHPVSEIASVLGRSVSAVRSRLKALGYIEKEAL